MLRVFELFFLCLYCMQMYLYVNLICFKNYAFHALPYIGTNPEQHAHFYLINIRHLSIQFNGRLFILKNVENSFEHNAKNSSENSIPLPRNRKKKFTQL